MDGLSKHVREFDELTSNDLRNVCRNIIEGEELYNNSFTSFATFLDMVRQMRHTQRRAVRNADLADKLARQEKEVDSVINRYFNAQLTIFGEISRKPQK